MSNEFEFLSDKDLIQFGLGSQPSAGIGNALAKRYQRASELIAQMKGRNSDIDALIAIYETEKLLKSTSTC